MNPEYHIPEPIVFNPLKHDLAYIKEFIACRAEKEYELKPVLKDIKHIGTSVMDVYSGALTSVELFSQVIRFLKIGKLDSGIAFANWTGTRFKDLKVITLSDNSEWALKFHNDVLRYVHLFPARSGPHSFRVKANTLKSAVLYLILIGKDYLSDDDLNFVRSLLGLSPIKDANEADSITRMIEVLRN
jgi:hypothetical protein